MSDVVSESATAGVGRPWYYALAVSSLTHLSIVLLLAGWTSVASSPRSSTVETRWTASEDQQQEIEKIEAPEIVATKMSQDAGGSRAASSMLASAQRLPIESPVSTETVLDAPVDDVLTSGGLADDVGVLPTTDFGDSTGEGTGVGDGKGDGFFGMRAAGTSFVFLVDCSLSMNHPHASPSKTRFRRLQLELVKSIGRMDPTHQFFVIFFNREIVPMPARSMQTATSENKQRFIKWVTKMRAVGDTDPRAAMSLALKLNPDVIYFLTDGSFEFRTKKALNKLTQKRIAIHTYALGNREGEPVLRRLAERNRGEYHFIP